MVKYKLFHLKSNTWVTAIHYGANHIEFVGYSPYEEHAKVFDESSFLERETMERILDLRRIYESDRACKFYSNELNAWLVDMTDGTLFEINAGSDNEIYPRMVFRKDKNDALVIRDQARIDWLKENTGLKIYNKISYDDIKE